MTRTKTKTTMMMMTLPCLPVLLLAQPVRTVEPSRTTPNLTTTAATPTKTMKTTFRYPPVLPLLALINPQLYPPAPLVTPSRSPVPPVSRLTLSLRDPISSLLLLLLCRRREDLLITDRKTLDCQLGHLRLDRTCLTRSTRTEARIAHTSKAVKDADRSDPCCRKVGCLRLLHRCHRHRPVRHRSLPSRALNLPPLPRQLFLMRTRSRARAQRSLQRRNCETSRRKRRRSCPSRCGKR